MSNDQNPSDKSLEALGTLLVMLGVSTSATQLGHELGHQRRIESRDLLRLCKAYPNIRARSITTNWQKACRLPLPALAEGHTGWFILGRVGANEALVQMPGQSPDTLARAEFESIWTGTLLLATSRASVALASRFDARWFMPQITKYGSQIGEVLLITLVINLLGLVGPLFFQAVVDKVLIHDAFATLTVLAIGFVGASIWEVALGWLRTRLYSEISQKLDVELGARLFRHLLGLPISYFEVRRIGDTVTRVRQLETIREFLTNASLSVFIDPLFTIVFLIAMWMYSPALLGVVVVGLVGYAIVSASATGPLRARLNEKYERGATGNALLVESVSGIHTIKAAAIEPQWRDRWEMQLAAYSAANQSSINIGNSASQSVQLISKLTMVGILYFGAKRVMGGELTVGGLIAFNMFSQHISGPVIRIAQYWQDFQQVRLSLERLGDVINTPAELTGHSNTDYLPIVGSVEFEKVHFRYGLDKSWVIEDLNLTIKPGEILGIVGSSGSGKSTLAKLLQRLYVPTSGRVLVDDIDLAQIEPAWLRRQIGVVLQDNILFNRSIRENIALSNPTMPLDRVIAAAKSAGAHEFILRQARGYDTLVEERGVNLSGGQRQRLAIARALVTEPRILIFDEATAALDAESEEIVQANMRMMTQGRTVIVIAHRLSAVRQCHRIISLEGGRIVESGTHEELISQAGRYADLYRRQLGLACESVV